MKLPTNNGRAVLTCDFYCFGVYAAPRLFDIFSSKNTAAFTPANTVAELIWPHISACYENIFCLQYVKVTCFKNYASIKLPIHFVIFFLFCKKHVSVLFGSEDSAINVIMCERFLM